VVVRGSLSDGVPPTVGRGRQRELWPVTPTEMTSRSRGRRLLPGHLPGDNGRGTVADRSDQHAVDVAVEPDHLRLLAAGQEVGGEGEDPPLVARHGPVEVVIVHPA
jgi:hypothetical protein